MEEFKESRNYAGPLLYLFFTPAATFWLERRDRYGFSRTHNLRLSFCSFRQVADLGFLGRSEWSDERSLKDRSLFQRKLVQLNFQLTSLFQPPRLNSFLAMWTFLQIVLRLWISPLSKKINSQSQLYIAEFMAYCVRETWPQQPVVVAGPDDDSLEQTRMISSFSLFRPSKTGRQRVPDAGGRCGFRSSRNYA